MMPADDLAYLIPTETVIDCNVCDKPNRTDIYDDIRTGDWAYLFQCAHCDHINDEHGNDLERGAVTVRGSVFGFLTAVCVLGFWLWQPVLFWAVVALTIYAVVCLGIIAVVAGGERIHKENTHE